MHFILKLVGNFVDCEYLTGKLSLTVISGLIFGDMSLSLFGIWNSRVKKPG